jgi:hypothetical protein
MGRIVITEFVSLDGVVEDPNVVTLRGAPLTPLTCASRTRKRQRRQDGSAD